MPITSCFAGEKQSFYSIDSITVRDAGCYYCQVENQYGIANSRSTVVAVTVTASLSARLPSGEEDVNYSPSLDSVFTYSSNLGSGFPNVDSAFTYSPNIESGFTSSSNLLWDEGDTTKYSPQDTTLSANLES